MSDEVDVILNPKEAKSFHVSGILENHQDFDGPLDLLLHLISENKANIYDLPIALITDQFIEYIKTHETELGDLADFYRMAAELLYIKTKLLLPNTTALDEEYEDPRSDLVDRLLDYQKYKRYTDLLAGSSGDDRLRIERGENFFAIPFEDKDLFDGVTLDDLKATFAALLENTPPSKIFNIYEEVSLHEKKALMMELLETHDSITIEDLIVDKTNPLHVIVSFMAILESVKDRLVLMKQDVLYGPIVLVKRPEDWTHGESYDEIDRRAAGEEEKSKRTEASDFNILTREAEMRLEDMISENKELAEELDEDDEKVEFVGEEEEIDLEDDDE